MKAGDIIEQLSKLRKDENVFLVVMNDGATEMGTANFEIVLHDSGENNYIDLVADYEQFYSKATREANSFC